MRVGGRRNWSSAVVSREAAESDTEPDRRNGITDIKSVVTAIESLLRESRVGAGAQMPWTLRMKTTKSLLVS